MVMDGLSLVLLHDDTNKELSTFFKFPLTVLEGTSTNLNSDLLITSTTPALTVITPAFNLGTLNTGNQFMAVSYPAVGPFVDGVVPTFESFHDAVLNTDDDDQVYHFKVGDDNDTQAIL